MSDVIANVLQDMIIKGIIPQNGSFEVENAMIDCYCKTYSSFRGNGNLGRNNNVRFARKMAGINLMKLSLSRNDSEMVYVKNKVYIKCGVVYIITNPSFEGYYKVGITQDLEKRLKSYQTSDPHKAYKVETYGFFEDRREVEKDILGKYRVDIKSGEWIKDKKCIKYIQGLCDA